MIKQPPSIFNDVIGPVMTGPSSSHTAGPTRIGLIARQLLAGNLRKATIEFSSSGSFAMCYKGQKTDKGLAGGLLGWLPEDARISVSLTEAAKMGIEIEFIIKDFEAEHPNTAVLHLQGDDGECVSATALSVGGGMVEIIDVNGFPVSISGDFHELLVFLNNNDEKLQDWVEKQIKSSGLDVQFSEFSVSGSKALILIKTNAPVPASIISELKSAAQVADIKQIAPVLPVMSRRNCTVPFKTSVELLRLASSQSLQPWEAAALYESSRSGWQVEEVLSRMEEIASIMKRSIDTGLSGTTGRGSILKPQSGMVDKAAAEGRLVPTGVINNVISRTMAVVEVNVSMGVVVAAPTAGSCGVLPGAILGTAEALGLSDKDTAKALLAAGAIGLLIAEQATFAAEVCGCQAECGAASSMAAAGIVQLAGGSSEQAVNAASIALQNVLGLICDPVAELVEVPCLGKNVMAATNAIASANMAIAGVDPIIPLDEVIKSMYDVGVMLPRELRCTGLGGLAVTETAQRIKRNISI
ncbi:MAG: L-serine dehydratase, beta subunit / L-serine dehydratase, alpha subunit [Firmicutes bacterium]|nr:L-serine dehydratase, beta subunit / L-serine dehydratase, alpha subunit [Bacillota bacterium]MDI6706942.1 L-serine ammonia-lyase, iron-sulfur-dependent, subunit alpha [Bacillota bacterium]